MKDPYEILGVPREAGLDEVKKAYRRLARERHPDSDPGNPWAEEEFKELSAAYEALARRAGKGRARAAGKSGGGKSGGGMSGGGRSGGGKPRGPNRGGKRTGTAKLDITGADVEYVLRVDFMDVARGAVRHINMANGKRLKVSVPAGTAHGRVLRLKGQGMGGIGTGADGDALVEVLVDPDPQFRRDGNDVHVEVPVTLPEAVLGAKIEAPTIDGAVTITVPKGSNTSTRLRLKGKGLKGGGKGGKRGDQFVHLRVVLPKAPDAELVKFVEDWAPKHGYKVRPKGGR